MADELKRVGLVFKADGSVDFQKSLKEINASVQENRTAFKLAQSQWDASTKSADKLKDRQKYLAQQTKDYSDKVKILEEQLKELESAEEKDQRAIERKRSQLNQAKTSLNNYKKGLEEVNQELKFGTERIEEYSKKVGEAGKKVTDAGKKMSAGVTAPIIGAGAAAGKLAMDFEDSMAKVSTIADTTQVPIEDLKDGIIDLSSKTGQSADDLSEAMYQAMSASVETGDAVEFLDTAVKAAVGGFTDNATAVDGLTSVLNSYGMEASNVESIANQMLITQNLGKTTFGELASSIGQVTPIAASLGITTEELFSSLAATTAQGLGTSESITALKAAMSNIIKPSNEAAEAAEALGIDFSVSALQSKGWIGFLEDVREGLKNTSPEYAKLLTSVEEGTKKLADMENAGKKNTDEYKALKKQVKASSKEMELLAQANDSTIGGFATMFGSVEGLNSVLMLTSEQGMQMYGEAMEEMQTNTTALDEAFAKMDETSGSQMKKAINDIKNAGIEIGDILLPVISGIVGKIREVMQAFSGLSDSQKETIVKVAAIAAAVGPLLIAFGNVCGGISKIIHFTSLATGVASKIPGIMTTIGVGAKALWGILSANPIGAVITIIGLLVGAFVTLWNKSEAFRNFWKGLWENIKEITSVVVDAVVKFCENLWEKTKEIFNKIKDTAANIWNGIKTVITNAINVVKNTVTNVLNAIKNTFSKIWNNIKTTVTNCLNGIKSNIKNGMNAAKNVISSVLNSIKSKFSSIFESAKKIVSNAINKIRGFFNFDWSLPRIKLPHFSISGHFSLNPPSIPHFSVDWYSKGGILNQPTIFGRNGNTLLGGGEAGKEAVLPIHLLKDYIREENIKNNGLLVKALKEAFAELNLVAENNIYLGDRKLAQILTDMVLKKIGNRATNYELAKGM